MKLLVSDKYANLSLTDWGVCINGEHFSADITYKSESIEVDQEMGSGLAGRLNKKDMTRSNRPGDRTLRFETEKSAIEASVAEARKRWPDMKFILVGHGTPGFIPWSVHPLVQAQMNKLYGELEGYHTFTNSLEVRDRKDEIYDEWDKLFKFLENYNGKYE